MALLRSASKGNYTIVHNHILKDKNLSWQAKGMYAFLVSLPDNWNFNVTGAATFSSNGIDATSNALKELVKHGYLVRGRTRKANGTMGETVYTVFNKPCTEKQHLEALAPLADSPLSDDLESDCPNPENPILDNPSLDNPILESSQNDEKEQNLPAFDLNQAVHPIVEKPVLENPRLVNPSLDEPVLEEPMLENPILENRQLLNTNKLTTNPSKNNKIIPHPPKINQSNPDPIKTNTMFQVREDVREQIEYEILVGMYEKNRVDMLVDVMTETICSDQPTIHVAGANYETGYVADKLRKIGFLHVQHMFSSLDKFAPDIRNIKNYILTMLFNEASSMSICIDAQVHHDLEHHWDDLASAMRRADGTATDADYIISEEELPY